MLTNLSSIVKAKKYLTFFLEIIHKIYAIILTDKNIITNKLL